MDSREFAAKTVDLAVENGLKEMGLSREEAVITVLEEPRFLKKAKVSISKKLTEGERAQQFVEQLLEKMGIAAVVERRENDEETELIVSTTESSAVIGKRGETLDAIQYLASMAANEENETFRRIVVDCENYRAKRVENLQRLADRMAQKAEETGRRVQLDPMNPYERRIIHSRLQANAQVNTESRGEDPNRYVVIYPKNRKFPDRRGNRPQGRNGDRPFNRDGKRPFGEGGKGDRDRERRGGERREFDRNPPKRNREIAFGTFLGNTRDLQKPAQTPGPQGGEGNFGTEGDKE